MKRRLTSLLLVLLVLPGLISTALAAKPPHVADKESLLTEAEEDALLQEIYRLQEQYAIDIVILTAPSFNGETAEEYADGYYDLLGCGDDGVLFLLSMEQREWYISTCGSMIYTLTDYGIQQLGESAVAYLAEGLYYEGFMSFLQQLPSYLDAYDAGNPVDGQASYSDSYYHGSREETVYYEEEFTPSIFLSLIIGMVVALIVVLIMRGSMNTKRKQHSAAAYMKTNSYRLNIQRDMFLYSNVSKVRKQQNTGSSGGGSSVHRSSGGRSHGGGGGKF